MAGSLEGLAYLNGCPLVINSQTLSALERLLHIIARVNVVQRPALWNRRHHGLRLSDILHSRYHLSMVCVPALPRFDTADVMAGPISLGDGLRKPLAKSDLPSLE
jgi:hypothetical protein